MNTLSAKSHDTRTGKTGTEADKAGNSRASSAADRNPLWTRLVTRSVGEPAVVQRLCTECEEELTELPVRAKLTVGPADDAFEREADEVAGRVMRTADSTGASVRRLPLLRRKTGSGNGAGSKSPPVSAATAERVRNPGPGEALDPSLRRSIEAVLNADLAPVKLHRSQADRKAADALGAKAFTHGRDIFLGSQQRPDDLRLLAHEATHVAQQQGFGSAESRPIRRNGTGYHEGTVDVVWSDDSAELYRRIVAAADASSDFAGIPRASMWQPFYAPAHNFFRRHSGRHLRDLNAGDWVTIHIAGFYDAEDTPGMSQVRIWHDEDVPAPAPEPTPAPVPAPAPAAPPPPPDLVSQGKIRWDEQTPERVHIIATGVTPRLIAADLYGDESLATHVWAVWDDAARGEPYTVDTELPTDFFVRIEYGRLRRVWRVRYESSTTIIDRSIWGARPPIVNDPSRSYEPYSGNLEEIYDSIAIHHSGNEGYRTIAEVQNVQMDDQGRADVAYHYGVSRWGTISEGRDIGVKGAHVEGGNTGKIGIVLLADLDEQVWDVDDEVTADMETALLQLIHFLRGRFPRIRYLGGHKEYNTSRSCPGNLGMARMNRWRSQTGLNRPSPVN